MNVNRHTAATSLLLVALILFGGTRSGLSQSASSVSGTSPSVHVDPATGDIALEWSDGSKLNGIASRVVLSDGTSLVSRLYKNHTILKSPGVITIRHSSPGLPALVQHVSVPAGKPWIEIQAELDSSGPPISTNHFAAVQIEGKNAVALDHRGPLRVLHVPYDNDMWFRFDSVALGKTGQTVTSNEVTTIYDNGTRNGFVLGSITHDTWKTSMAVRATDGAIEDLEVFGGLQGKLGERSDTHDFVQHGMVSGTRVLSPRVMVGYFHDWRDGMEAFGKRNAELQKPLAWAGPRPLGWNSWAAYGSKINRQRYIASAQFINDKLEPLGFSRKVMYINFDAFWSNLDGVALEDAMTTVKSMQSHSGVVLEPGIYWTPFAAWGDDLDAFVEGTNGKYRYRDILLKDANGEYLPKVDGGRPIDPTAQGTRMRTKFYVDMLAKMGFKYLKLDFISHGALEGAHADPAIQTGTEAFNLGMRDVLKANAGRMYLSLSIAPLFPSGYGNARRLSCDTKGHINGKDQSTEYMLNALTYGWWTDKSLYVIDPDHVPLGSKADEGARNLTEARSRLLSAIISGGMILDSTPLADDPEGQAMALQVYDNPALMKVANEGKTFRPIEGDTGNAATNVFARPSSVGYYVAIFNYDDKQSKTVHVDLDRISPRLPVAEAHDVGSGDAITFSTHDLTVSLEPSESRLIEIKTSVGALN